MPGYTIPAETRAKKLKKKQVQLIANGDLRLSANQVCWPAQKAMEERLTDQGGREVHNAVERRLHRRAVHVAAQRVPHGRSVQAQARSRDAAEEGEDPRPRAQAWRGTGGTADAREGDHGRVRRRMHGNV